MSLISTIYNKKRLDKYKLWYTVYTKLCGGKVWVGLLKNRWRGGKGQKLR